MSHADEVKVGPQNAILAQLPPAEVEQLKTSLFKVQFVRDQVLVAHGQPTDQLLFIVRGVASVNAEPQYGEAGMQAAMIGRDGIVGDLSRFDPRHAPNAHVVACMPGVAWSLAGDRVEHALRTCPVLQEACRRFAQSLVAQIMQNAACTAQLSLTQYCARWMAMIHDRIDGDEISITHEALSATLGVRRSSVAFAMAALQQSGLIRTGRGRFTVLDSAGLDRVARGTSGRAGWPGAPIQEAGARA